MERDSRLGDTRAGARKRTSFRSAACALVVCLISCDKAETGAMSAAAGTGQATQGSHPARAPNVPRGGTPGSAGPSVPNGKGGVGGPGGESRAGGATPGVVAQAAVHVVAGSGGSSEIAARDIKASEWRMMGYDEKNWYFNPNEKTLNLQNAKQLTEKWRFKVSGFPLGSPVVAEGKVFAMAQGGIYALDLETGTQLWFRSDIVGSASVAYRDGFIYAQHSAAPPQVYKLKASDGSTVWGPIMNCQNERACSGESSPILVGNTVYLGMENNLLEASFDPADAAGARGGVRALDAENGSMRWLYYTIPESTPTGENGAAVWSTVSVDTASGMLFATTGNNYTVAGSNGDAFHAIDLATGVKRWVHQVREGDIFTVSAAFTGDNTTHDFDFGANPILAEVDGKQIVAAGDKGGAFWALDRDTGDLLWSREDLSASHDATYGGIFINGGFDGRAFYVVSNDPKSAGAVLHRLDPANNGASTWTHPFNATTWGALSLANSLLFVPNNATLYVMNAETGEVLTQFDTGGTIAGGAPAIAQGKIVVKSGFLYTDPATKSNDQIICYAIPGASPANTTTAGAAGNAAVGGASPATNPASFSAIYQSVILDAGCSSGQCHSAFAAGALDMSTQDAAYKNLVGVKAMGMTPPGATAAGCNGSDLTRVVAGDPDHSLLVAKLEHTQTCGAPMPAATVKLPDAQLQQIRAWISAGAAKD